MFVGGDWRASATGETFEATSPATGEVIGTVPQGDRDDARHAIEAARAAADGWARLTAFERAGKMATVAEVIESRRDELARTLTVDQGKPLRAEAYDEVDELVEYWHMAAEDAKRLGGELPNSFSPGKRVFLVRRPRGVVGVISPWNWPYTMPAELVAPALACGNAVVWTPAPSTAVCAVALARCIADADLPPGVFNLVTGPGPVVGDEIARSPGTDGVGLHWIDRDRAPRRAGRRRQGRAARDGRQRAAGGDGRRRPRGGRRRDADRLLPVRRPELHRGRAAAGASRGARPVRRAARAEGHRADPARRPVRRCNDDGTGEQRARGAEDGRARRRRRGARRQRGHRRRAGHRVPDLAVLAADRAFRRPARFARRGRGDVRPDRSGRLDRFARSTRSRWPTRPRTACSPRSSPPTWAPDWSSPTASAPAG